LRLVRTSKTKRKSDHARFAEHWRAGQIVSRKESDGLVAVVATDGRTSKVEWGYGQDQLLPLWRCG
jgi:uncharacterized membrane protein YgcG